MRLGIIFVLLFSAFAASGQSVTALQTFEKAVASASVGDYAAALVSFEKTLDLIQREHAPDKFFARVHYNLGVSHYQLRQPAEAVNRLERSIKYSNTYDAAQYALGLAQYELGDLKAAERAFKSAIVLNSRNGEAWFDLGVVYLAANDPARAKRAFDKAIRLGVSERAASHNNLGVLLAIEGKLTDAIMHFAQAATLGERTGAATANLEKCRQLVENNTAKFIASEFRFTRRGTAV